MRIVKNGDVHVSAPIGLSRKRVEAFIEEHSDWISKARKRVVERQQKRTDFYNQLPLTTKAQKEEALKRLKTLVEPMIEQKSLPIIIPHKLGLYASILGNQSTVVI